MKYVFDTLIVAMTSLLVASCFTPAVYVHLLYIVPLCVIYGATEFAMGSIESRYDPHEPEIQAVRHRFCMVLYMHGIVVSDWRVGAVLLGYAIAARNVRERGVMIVVHGLGMIGLAVATVFAEPKGIAAWAPVLTLVAILVFLVWIDNRRQESRHDDKTERYNG